MAKRNYPVKKDLVSSTSTCNFLGRAKQQLKDIQVLKKRINKFCGSHAEECYISFEVKNQDVLEHSRIKLLLDQALNDSKSEIEANVRNLLSNSSPSSEAGTSDLGNVRKHPTPQKKSPILSREVQNKVTSSHSLPEIHRNSSPNLYSLPQITEPKVTSSQHSRNVPISGTRRKVAFKNDDESVFTNDFMEELLKFRSSYGSPPKCVWNEGSYIPCAIPLAEPCRTMPESHFPPMYDNIPSADFNAVPTEVLSMTTTTTTAMQKKVLFLEVNEHIKPTLIEQTLPSVDIQGEEFHPVVRTNTQLITIVAEEGSNKKMVESKQASMQPQFSSEEANITEEAKQIDMPVLPACIDTVEPRENLAALAELVSTIELSEDGSESKESEKSPQGTEDRKEMNINIEDAMKQNDLNFRKEMPRPVMVSQSTQVDGGTLHSIVQSTSEQLEVSKTGKKILEKAEDYCVDHSAQTDVKGQLHEQLVFKTKQPAAILMEDSANVLITARTSTPIFELGTDADRLPLISPELGNCFQSNDELEISVPISQKFADVKDAASQCHYEVKCQTLPQTRTIAVQADVQIFSAIMSRDVGVQSDVLDVSNSSTVSTSTESEFIDDLLSEGEINLPWNLRLLSILERAVTMGTNYYEFSSETDASLSEGEIRPKIIHNLQEALTSGSSFTASSSSTSRENVPAIYITNASASGPEETKITSFNTTNLSSDLVHPSSSDNEALCSSDTGGSSSGVLTPHTPSVDQSHSMTDTTTTRRELSQNAEVFFKALSNFLLGKPLHTSLNTKESLKAGSFLQTSVQAQHISKSPDLIPVTEESSGVSESVESKVRSEDEELRHNLSRM